MQAIREATNDNCVIVIEPSRSWVSLDLSQVWGYRELLYFLIWRDVKVRYKQTALGAAWAILQPFLTMLVFSLFITRCAKSDTCPFIDDSHACTQRR